MLHVFRSQTLLVNERANGSRVNAMNFFLNAVIRAIKSNDVESLVAAFPRIESVRARIDSDETLMHLAARFGNPHAVRLLLEQQADIEPLNLEGHSPLIVAVKEGHAEVVRLLLQAGARMAYSISRYEIEAERRESVRLREELRQRLKSADERAKLATVLDTILPLLDQPDDEFLRSQTVEVNAMDCCWDLPVLTVLVGEFNADPNWSSNCGPQPLWQFADAHDLEAVRWLLSHGAKVDGCGDSQTALFAGVRNDHLEMIRLLLEAGANVNHRDCDDCVPLGSCRSVAAVQLLLQHGADPTLRDAYDRPCWEFILDPPTRQMLETIAGSAQELP